MNQDATWYGGTLPTTSSLETEWDYSGRKGRGGQKKKIDKVNKKRKK